MIGTLGAFVNREPLSATANTTPEPITLHRLLRHMAGAGCTHVVMEASSQAAAQHRLEGLRFDVGIFLNLSPDHIGPGEHRDFEEYLACKREILGQCAVVAGNTEDPAWPALSVGLAGRTYPFHAAEVRPGPGLTTMVGDLTIPLPGTFNGENARAAITAARLLGLPEAAVRQGLEQVQVPGRCGVRRTPDGVEVVIDYAHNGASFSALLAALRRQGEGRILAVFGAGGDRPPMRRRDLARAAAEGADYAVITEDNPRGEENAAICAQISAAMPDLPHEIVPDRRQAIFRALDLARPGDVVALLGKGHEQYIEEKGVRRHFSEWEVLEECLKR